jgi:hypothetical protein
MPEGTREASVLIATSYQALNRELAGSRETRIADCTVLILFAGFYIEATLNYIANKTGKSKEMASFLGRPYPGMQDKLGWFYNEFIARSKASTKKQLYDNGIEQKLRRKFPGFARLYRFRNDISHGKINASATSVATAKVLRRRAKNLVGLLYAIPSRKGYKVPRLITYRAAIASLKGRYP